MLKLYSRKCGLLSFLFACNINVSQTFSILIIAARLHSLIFSPRWRQNLSLSIKGLYYIFLEYCFEKTVHKYEECIPGFYKDFDSNLKHNMEKIKSALLCKRIFGTTRHKLVNLISDQMKTLAAFIYLCTKQQLGKLARRGEKVKLRKHITSALP